MEGTVGEESDVSMTARVRSDQWAEVGRPTQSDRVDRPLDAGIAHSDDIDLDSSKRLVLGSRNCGEHRQIGFHD
jgi:hypothetical protein